MREHRPVIALDFPSFEAVKEFLSLFPAEESLYLKVGMELYYAEGPEVVRYLKSLGHSESQTLAGWFGYFENPASGFPTLM